MSIQVNVKNEGETIEIAYGFRWKKDYLSTTYKLKKITAKRYEGEGQNYCNNVAVPDKIRDAVLSIDHFNEATIVSNMPEYGLILGKLKRYLRFEYRIFCDYDENIKERINQIKSGNYKTH